MKKVLLIVLVLTFSIDTNCQEFLLDSIVKFSREERNTKFYYRYDNENRVNRYNKYSWNGSSGWVSSENEYDFVYNSDDQLVEKVSSSYDPKKKFVYQYDEYNNLSRITMYYENHYDAQLWTSLRDVSNSYTYSDSGLILSATLATEYIREWYWPKGYDATEYTYNGNSVTKEFDTRGNLLSVVDAYYKKKYVYNENNQIINYTRHSTDNVLYDSVIYSYDNLANNTVEESYSIYNNGGINEALIKKNVFDSLGRLYTTTFVYESSDSSSLGDSIEVVYRYAYGINGDHSSRQFLKNLTTGADIGSYQIDSVVHHYKLYCPDAEIQIIDSVFENVFVTNEGDSLFGSGVFYDTTRGVLGCDSVINQINYSINITGDTNLYIVVSDTAFERYLGDIGKDDQVDGYILKDSALSITHVMLNESNSYSASMYSIRDTNFLEFFTNVDSITYNPDTILTFNFSDLDIKYINVKYGNNSSFILDTLKGDIYVRNLNLLCNSADTTFEKLQLIGPLNIHGINELNISNMESYNSLLINNSNIESLILNNVYGAVQSNSKLNKFIATNSNISLRFNNNIEEVMIVSSEGTIDENYIPNLMFEGNQLDTLEIDFSGVDTLDVLSISNYENVDLTYTDKLLTRFDMRNVYNAIVDLSGNIIDTIILVENSTINIDLSNNSIDSIITSNNQSLTLLAPNNELKHFATKDIEAISLNLSNNDLKSVIVKDADVISSLILSDNHWLSCLDLTGCIDMSNISFTNCYSLSCVQVDQIYSNIFPNRITEEEAVGEYEVTDSCEICSFIIPEYIEDTIVVEDSTSTEDSLLTFVGYDKSSYSIYPNPVEEYIIIDLKNSNFQSLSIRNISGQILVRSDFNGSKMIVDVSQLKAGIYFVQLNSKVCSITEKIIIK